MSSQINLKNAIVFFQEVAYKCVESTFEEDVTKSSQSEPSSLDGLDHLKTPSDKVIKLPEVWISSSSLASQANIISINIYVNNLLPELETKRGLNLFQDAESLEKAPVKCTSTAKPNVQNLNPKELFQSQEWITKVI